LGVTLALAGPLIYWLKPKPEAGHCNALHAPKHVAPLVPDGGVACHISELYITIEHRQVRHLAALQLLYVAHLVAQGMEVRQVASRDASPASLRVRHHAKPYSIDFTRDLWGGSTATVLYR